MGRGSGFLLDDASAGRHSRNPPEGSRTTMAKAYSSDVCHELAGLADAARLLRPRRITRHEAGEVLELDLTGVVPAWRVRAAFQLERYVGGGFAGQVYQARLARLDWPEGAGEPPMVVGGVYALKVFVPWSGFGRGFRNALYGLGFQSAFGLQSNPQAARACALWHKFIRRGAAEGLGSEQAIVDVFATFHDPTLGSMGEVLEWVDGRVWRLEVNDRLFARGDTQATEFDAKRAFMARLVRLFHEMGGPELARQYEWWTMKSQPNALKRREAGEGPAAGLVAVDFGAGLALLPFLPMSPADVWLIARGLARGRLVQFDRGDLDRLEAYVHAHPHRFDGMGAALAELRTAEAAYHGAQPDLANRGLDALHDRTLPLRVRRNWIQGYRTRGVMDAGLARRMQGRPEALLLFVVLGLVPVLGRFIQRVWGNGAYWRHVRECLTSGAYLKRAVCGRACECLIDWHRAGRVSEARARWLARHPAWFWIQAVPLGWLPAGLHRALTDPRYAWDVVRYVVLRPVKLYVNAAYRRDWLVDMVREGERDGMLQPDEARHILDRIDEPFIQKYLKCLAVHVCTLPVTQVVSVAIALYYFFFIAETWQDAWTWSLVILAAFQVTPISPGSFCRGAYVVYLMIRERNWYDYRLASAISFWKYIGYLGFPIQMVSSYPTLARFMAARWAMHGIRLIPVFGEHGALLEHGFFNAFFNVPVSLRRRWAAWDGRHRLMTWIGAVGGVGFLPGPTGTYASFLTAAALLGLFHLGCPWWAVFVAIFPITAVGIVAAGGAETYLGKKDPRPFVLDEVVGQMIACLAVWGSGFLAHVSATVDVDITGWLPLDPAVWAKVFGSVPGNPVAWGAAVVAFVWFRVLDILKPPPVRQMERLPGGWGIMADDVFAGGMALLLTVACQMAVHVYVG